MPELEQSSGHRCAHTPSTGRDGVRHPDFQCAQCVIEMGFKQQVQQEEETSLPVLVGSLRWGLHHSLQSPVLRAVEGGCAPTPGRNREHFCFWVGNVYLFD